MSPEKPLKDAAEQLQFTQERLRGALAVNTGIQMCTNMKLLLHNLQKITQFFFILLICLYLFHIIILFIYWQLKKYYVVLVDKGSHLTMLYYYKVHFT